MLWARTVATDPSLGFAAPLIYQDAASHSATDFHDVTSGNNSGETAATGWDYTTGFGSINIANFVADVAGGGGTPPAGGTPSDNFTYTTNRLTTTFTDESTDKGGTSSAQDPSHTYTAAGTYSVTETVTDSVDGETSAKTESVRVTTRRSRG